MALLRLVLEPVLGMGLQNLSIKAPSVSAWPLVIVAALFLSLVIGVATVSRPLSIIGATEFLN